MGVAARQLEFDEARRLSVQEHPEPEEGRLNYGGYINRGPLLPAPGSTLRQWWLRQYWYHDYNGLFKSAAAGVIKSIQSTPWEVRADDPTPWQTMLMAADFGDWDRYLSKIITDFLRFDHGSFIELIAPGDPLGAPTGPVVGLSVLDALRCWPTGNLDYPVIYYDRNNQMHKLHRTRVVQFVDSPNSEEYLAGYGDCALARCIGTVKREILMNQYIEQKLDDKPPPGLMVLGNISKEMFSMATQEMHDKQSTDEKGVWGRITMLYGAAAEVKPTADMVTFSQPPEAFNLIEYTELNVKMMAAGLGIDLLELWELTRGGLGQGTQSEVMRQKSRGKLKGRIMKGLERVINQALPPDVEFAFQYKDAQEDQEEAEKAKVWTGVAAAIKDDTTTQERRELLARQVPAVQDTLSEDDGTIRRLPDDDPKADDEPTVEEISQPATADDAETMEVSAGQKALSDTTGEFEDTFTAFVRAAQQGGAPGALRAVFRNALHDAGMAAYEDGLRAGGVEPDEADAETKADRRRRVAEWLAVQDTYIRNFVDDIRGREEPVSKAEIALRAQMWANKSLHSIYYAGLYEASKSKLYQWQYAAEKDHCATCLSLHGQVHSLRTWMKSGFTPKCTCLECGGYLCGCEFKDATTGPRGRIPGRNRLRTTVDFIGDFVRRVATQKDWVDVPDVKPQWDNHTAALAGYMQYVAGEE